MILKRLVLNLATMLIGGISGLVIVQIASYSMVVPPVAAIIIALLGMGLGFIAGHLLGAIIFPIAPHTVIRPEIPRQTWAWLRPQGEGPRAGFPLNRDRIIIGREVSCDVMLNNNSVSRTHSEIVRLAEGYLLKDLGSRNGTFVNGQRIEETLLQDGDTVTIGDVILKFEAPLQTEGIQPISTSAQEDPTASPGVTISLSGTPSSPSDDDDEPETEVWRPTSG